MPPPDLPDFPASQLFLRRLAYSLVRDPARAEDLVQDTWTTWIEHRPARVAEPKAWLARVLRNHAFNLKRGEQRRARRETLAGRPDPLSPETDGTLEAQEQLLAALRALDEPYRSTLVQRYYHDLSPKEIAERSGAPLDTVKSRLARGLERLRGALDSRYRGDRGAWCHWLASLANPPPMLIPGVRGPHAPAPPVARVFPAPRAAGLPASSGAPAALTSWIALAAALVAGVGWIVLRSGRAPIDSSPVTFVEPSAREVVELVDAPIADWRAKEQPSPVGVVPPPKEELEPEPLPVAFAPPAPFEWPQLGGGPTHDTYTPFVERVDLIARPRVAWTLPGLAGQPTIAGTELYSGGNDLYRVDLVAGKAFRGSEEVRKRIEASVGSTEELLESWQMWCIRNGLLPGSWVAAAPAITESLVIARFVGTGGVSAFDRDLAGELWHWEPSAPAPCPLTGCLVADRYIVAHRNEVVSLDAGTGSVDWRFEIGEAGEVRVVPACDGDLVYVATERGVVVALELARGHEKWRVETGRAFSGASPVVLGDRVLLLDDGEVGRDPRWQRPELRALQTYDGRELWRASVDTLSGLAVGGGFVAFIERYYTVLRSAESGNERGRLRSREGFDTVQFAATPLVVGEELWAPTLDEKGGHLGVRNIAGGLLRWTYDLGATGAVLDLVHAGDRIYAATGHGLVCIADEPGAEPAPPGYAFGPGASAKESERSKR